MAQLIAASMEKELPEKYVPKHCLKQYRNKLFFGVSVLVILQIHFSASLLTAVQVAEHDFHKFWGGSGRSNDGNAAVIEVKRPLMFDEKTSQANKTAFELLHEYNNCSAILPDGLACWNHCKPGKMPENDPARKKWCEEIVCRPNTCRSFTCLLGNPPPLPTVLELHVHPPSASSKRPPGGGRRIPKIIHQTWNEPLTKERYPNWSQFQMSFQQQAGYDYRFYTDSAARDLIQSHFPPEVVQAYDNLIPGAYKADLFRYCALLIHGGVYADIDVLMVSKLDALIPDDVGFVIPLDLQRFHPSNGALCLWNAFVAASPGHPYLAKAIENVVNAVRNRYNYVDLAHMVTCPFKARETEVTRVVTLLATGPCMLGLTVNQVLGRHEQTPLELGEFQGSNEVPGTTLFLAAAQNEDMAFTVLHAGNVAVIGNDAGKDDRNLNLGKESLVHHYSYSVTKNQTLLFGEYGVYRGTTTKARTFVRLVVRH